MKNKEQKLSELISKIRELLPRLMELEKGCKFSYAGQIHEIVNVGNFPITEKGGGELFFDTLENNSFCTRFLPCYTLSKHNIIGKEPTIFDLLEVFKLLKHPCKITSSSVIEVDTGVKYYEKDVDLSKPYIKDLEEETINFLHSVLCEK